MATSEKGNEAKMFSLVAQWQEVGGSKSKFCRENNIHKSGFYYWLKKYNNKYPAMVAMATKPAPESFSKISITSAKPKVNPLTITYPNGVTISTVTTELDTLTTLIKLWN